MDLSSSYDFVKLRFDSFGNFGSLNIAVLLSFDIFYNTILKIHIC